MGAVSTNPVRDRIYRAIVENPGITIIAIARSVGVRHQTVCYHLKKLRRRGHVVSHAKGNRLLHFVNGAVASEGERDLILVAHDPVTMSILARITEQPGLLRKEVAGTSGLTRTGAAWHVNKLVKHGIVRERRTGGHCHLYVVDERASQVRLLVRSSAQVRSDIEAGPAPPTDGPAQVRVPVEAGPRMA